MATYGQTVRRGMPRRPGGEPWPADGDAAAVVALAERDETPPAVAATAAAEAAAPLVVERAQRDETPSASERTAVVAPAASSAGVGAGAIAMRRGLPRVAGGEPWPPASTALPAGVAETASSAPTTAQDATPEQSVAAVGVARTAASTPATPQGVTPERGTAAAAGARVLRRGLPRSSGGEPWPPAGFAPATALAVDEAVTDAALASSPVVERAEQDEAPDTQLPAGTAAVVDLSVPLAFTRTVWPGKGAFTHPTSKPEPQRIGPFTKLQWAGAVIVGGGGLLFAAGMAVLFVRWLLSLAFMVDFLTTYPGEYKLPAGAPVGIPPWLGWQHFFNVFLMVLIIRSGLQVRTEKRPTAFWSPRNNPNRKISLNLWFHQSLDILWIVNGVIFVVLLFATGQWMKIVPTSWEVIPNAISAALQYVSLDWPTENGWVNYNSLQQLAYFATVFVAAPLAIVTGVRMSGVWPKNAKALSIAYPVEWARAVHFPVMLYFVVFIALHVFLVLATGALRNLNHMYASLGSTDPEAYADNWVGFWLFAASLVVIAAAWVAARPLVLAPIARLFGRVSGR